MSTATQLYSPEKQSDAILQYAVRYGFDIVRTYADNGKSGLRLEGRDALKQWLIDRHQGVAAPHRAGQCDLFDAYRFDSLDRFCQISARTYLRFPPALAGIL